MAGAAILVFLAQAYLAIGGLIAIAFLVHGIDRVDPSANRAYAFRTLLFPGICLIWPLVLWRWHRLEMAVGAGG